MQTPACTRAFPYFLEEKNKVNLNFHSFEIVVFIPNNTKKNYIISQCKKLENKLGFFFYSTIPQSIKIILYLLVM